VPVDEITQFLLDRPWTELCGDNSSQTLTAVLPEIGKGSWVSSARSTRNGTVINLRREEGPQAMTFVWGTGERWGIETFVLLLYRQGKDIVYEWFNAPEGNVRDVDGDGTMDVLMRDRPASNAGQLFVVPWPTIFTFDGKEFVKASYPRFQEFYKDYLAKVEKDIAEYESQTVEQMMADSGWERATAEDFRDSILTDRKTLRFLAKQMLGEPKAGFDQAKTWARDDVRAHRADATVIFAAIGDDASRQELERLSQDKDEGVAAKAKYRLSEIEPGTAAPSPTPVSGQKQQ
jgi:hypothetical protein